MKTTIREIKRYSPCYSIVKLNALIEKAGGVDVEITLKQILAETNIQGAIWCLRCFDYKDYCLFLADVAESVLVFFEKKHPDDKRPREAIEAIRLFEQGKITKSEFEKYSAAAAAAAYSAYSAYSAADAADAAAYSAAAAVDAAAAAAYSAAADAAVDAAAASSYQWYKIAKLFISHFCK